MQYNFIFQKQKWNKWKMWENLKREMKAKKATVYEMQKWLNCGKI